MRTKGKAKIRTADNVNVCSNELDSVNNTDACVSTGMHMHETSIPFTCEQQQHACVAPHLKRKAGDTFLVSERHSSKRLAYEGVTSDSTTGNVYFIYLYLYGCSRFFNVDPV